MLANPLRPFGRLVGLGFLVVASALPAQTQKATVEVSVKNREGAPIPGVAVELLPVDRKKVLVTTDSAGLAEFAGVEPGTAFVTTRKVGFKPGELRAGFAAGRNTLPIIVDAVAAPTLAAVRVVGNREVLARHQDFETRHLLGLASASITELDIEKRNPVDTWQMLTNVPSVKVASRGAGTYVMSMRGKRPTLRNKLSGLEPCWMRVMVDGVALPDSMPDLSVVMPRPKEVHGIEVFAGPATIPLEYKSMLGGSGDVGQGFCGLIAVWTK